MVGSVSAVVKIFSFDLGWSVPSRGCQRLIIRLPLQKQEINAGSIGHLVRKGFS